MVAVRTAWIVAWLIAAAFSAAHVYAADTPAPEPTTYDEKVVVIGTRIDPIATGASKMDTPLIETPQSVSIIDSELLDLRGAYSLNQALRYTAGVTPESRGGVVTRYDQFTLRGFSESENYLDGMALLYNNWYAAPQVDASTVERIEILKGPSSVLYGNSPPGGLINFVSKQPQETPSANVSLDGGTQSLWSASADVTGPIDDDAHFLYRMIGLYRESDGQASGTENERRFAAPSFTWQPDERTRLTISGFWQDDPKSGAYGSVPALGSALDNPLGQLHADFYDGDRGFEEFEREQSALGYAFEHEFDDVWSFKQSLRGFRVTTNYKSVYSAGLEADDRTLDRASIFSDESSDAFTVDNQLIAQFDTGPFAHHVLFGVDYQKLDSHVKVGYGSAPPIDIFAPDNDQGIAMPPPYFDVDIKYDQTGYYLQDQINLDRWVLLAGTRYDDYHETDKDKNGLIDDDIDQDNWSERIGLLYLFDNGIAPYVSYSESFQPQTGFDFSGQTFKPTTGEQIEGGLKYEAPRLPIYATVSVFDLKKQNVVTADPNNPGFSVQTGEIESKGVEFESTVRPVENLEVSAAYTHLNVANTKSNDGLEHMTPVWVADDTASLWMMYRFADGALRGLGIGGGIRYVGSSWVDPQNTEQVPSYTLYDGSIEYDLSHFGRAFDDTRIVVSGSNLADNTHVAGCYSTSWCWFGAERTVQVSLQRRW